MKVDIQLYSIPELKEIKETILTRIRQASSGQDTCFAYQEHAITKKGHLPRTPVQVLVIGGTNLVRSLVKKTESGIEILSSEREKLPVLSSRDVFIDYLAGHISSESEFLAINFAYPLKPFLRDGYLDGILLRGTKEHTFKGMVGEPVGEILSDHVQNKTGREIRVTVANDTVCLVLAGLIDDDPERLSGGVVGTGFNFAYFSDSSTLVNLESGNFNSFKQTDTGKIIDQSSSKPGVHIFEKEISGAYLYQHYNLLASRESYPSVSSTRELAEMADGDSPHAELARNLIRRSASLVAAHICALYELKGLDSITVLIEGSLFWKGWKYHDIVLDYIEELGCKKECFNIKRIPESYIIGASQLFLY